MPRFSPSGFFGPSRCLIPTPGLTSKYPICAVYVCVCVYTHTRTHTLPPDSWAHIQVPHLCSVCVCVRIHTHTHTYTPTRVENRDDTDNTPIFPAVKNNPPRQATSALKQRRKLL